jgi:superfamily II DNA/RNA helicase
MKPEKKSQRLLAVTRSKAKMLEYGVPEEHHINIAQDPGKLFTISIGLLGDLAATINRQEKASPDSLLELRKNLLFSARFFDSYLQSELNKVLDPYLMLMGSASYYLCELPGSASVLAKRIDGDYLDLDGDGLEDLLLWLLQADWGNYFDGSEGPFGVYIDGISRWLHQFFEDGKGEDNLQYLGAKLRHAVYEFGTPRQLLLGDVITAVLRKKLENSAWKALPIYSELSRDNWLQALQKKSFIKELWPAQHLLGKAGVLRGESAIVQMPTSAGKTKATELILRSAFLAERVKLAIIIAPFRALCHEIKNSLVEAFHNESIRVDELSDVMQTDFEIEALLVNHQILVVTPEKLLYVLRRNPELATYVGLLVFDEGHQFDNGTRGIAYELLLTSLRSMIPAGAQKVLVSAVISNAEAVGEWLNGDPKTVDGQNLLPTHRSVGFASFSDLKESSIRIGWMKYVNPQNPEALEYFVPHVIEKIKLARKKGESLTKPKYFPNPTAGKEIAIFLGLKLVSKGAVAIFCGRKDTASSLCKLAAELFSRDLPLTPPNEFSDHDEVSKLIHLIDKNLGSDSPSAISARIGIFSHHGNTPHGLRLAVEHAMRNESIRFVICTSTLAQGVNLPIRYLIVTSVYQGVDRIKVRDFHNLIGRVGRAGMHTEGSVLFADPVVYDTRTSLDDKWRWEQVKKLLEPQNSEPCISNLLSIFEPIKSDDGKYTIKMDALDFAKAYINDPDEVVKMAAGIVTRHSDKHFSRYEVERQVVWRINLICAVESFLLSHWDETEDGLSEAGVISLAEGTLAFFLADEQQREHIRGLFNILADNISVTISDPVRRKTYGRTLYGVQDAQAIEGWVKSNSASLLSIVDDSEILDRAWPLFAQHIKDGIFTKFDKPEVIKEIAHGWILGIPFGDILKIIRERKVKMIWGTKRREFKIDHVVDICEGTFAYEGALLIGAVCEFLEILNQEGTVDLVSRLKVFQKRLKYGLPTEATIGIYERGFSDRVISQDLATSLNLSAAQKKDLVEALKQDRNRAIALTEKYPSYFQERMNELLQLTPMQPFMGHF